jgi:hypothetical protein
MDGNGNPVMPGGQASNNFGGLQEYTKYFGQACAANGFGAVSTGVQQAYTFTVSPGGQGVTYTVGVDPSRTITSGAFTSGYEFLNVTAPNVPQRNLFGVFYRINGQLTSNFSLSRDVDPGHITYSYCFLSSTSACGAEADVTSTTIPTTVTVNVPTDCTAAPTKDDIVFSGAVKSANAYTIDIANDTAALTVSYKITFTGAYAALGERTLTRCGVAAPTNPNPDPGTGGGGGSGGGTGG